MLRLFLIVLPWLTKKKEKEKKEEKTINNIKMQNVYKPYSQIIFHQKANNFMWGKFILW
jgi:hypothetical protein